MSTTVMALRPGDDFVTVPREKWDSLSEREKNNWKKYPEHKPVTFLKALPTSQHSMLQGRVNIKTSRGDWSIPVEAPVTIFEAAPA